MQNTGKINIKIDGKNNEQVNEYKHLGAIIQNDIYKTIFKTVYRSTLMYDNEAWTVNATWKSKLQATEMKYLLGVKGIKRRDRIKNEDVRTKLGTKSTLEVEVWSRHAQSMEETR